MKSCIFLMPGRLYTSRGSPLPRAQATNAFIASAPRYRSPSGAIAQALALHSSRVSPTEAGVQLFWKGTAVTRRLRSSAFRRRTERVQKPQAPSNTRVRCCGRSVKVTKPDCNPAIRLDGHRGTPDGGTSQNTPSKHWGESRAKATLRSGKPALVEERILASTSSDQGVRAGTPQFA